MEYGRVNIKYDNNEISLLSLFESDHIYKHLKKTGNFYELKLLEKVKSLNLTGTYIDVGANIGNHTIFFSKFCKSTQVISIELNCEIYKVLQQNVINSPNVSTINIGVGEKFKHVKISNIDETNVGMTKIIGENGDIVVDTLDSILSDVNNISIIKIDVEGYEKNVLIGAKNIISKHSPVIIAELRDEKEFDEFEKISNDIGYFTDKINYASTPTYFWYKKNEIYDFVYIIPTYERFDKVKPLIDDILTKNLNTLIIVLSDGSSDKRYKTLINFNKRVVYIENRTNNAKEKYWLTVNTLLNEMSKYKFKYGVMLGDDFTLIDGYQEKLEKYISDGNIVRLFTQQSIGDTNWGFKDWVDGAFCAPYSFFQKINFELFPIKKLIGRVSSGVGQQMSQRLTNLNYVVKNYGSLIRHIGNDDSKMHPTIRLNQPLVADFKIQQKLLTIIIPTFNNVEFIKECLSSVIKSVKSLNCEILVGIDSCEKTLEFVSKNMFDGRVRFLFFQHNVGPYIIKNSLVKNSNSDTILFFDSDDIMCENMVEEIIKLQSFNDFVRPKYINFNGLIPTNPPVSNEKLFGEGVFSIKKELFLSMNGFEPWRTTADTDFMGRLYKNSRKSTNTPTVLFYRRIHQNSLTQSKQTGHGSKVRQNYNNLIRNKTSFGPLPNLSTSPFIEISVGHTKPVEIFDEVKHKKMVVNDMVKGILNKTNISKTIDYDLINKNTQKQGVYVPINNVKPIRENKPVDRMKITELKKDSLAYQSREFGGIKKTNKSSSPNIFGGNNKRKGGPLL